MSTFGEPMDWTTSTRQMRRRKGPGMKKARLFQDGDTIFYMTLNLDGLGSPRPSGRTWKALACLFAGLAAIGWILAAILTA